LSFRSAIVDVSISGSPCDPQVPVKEVLAAAVLDALGDLQNGLPPGDDVVWLDLLQGDHHQAPAARRVVL
jgi:hypothetical protein